MSGTKEGAVIGVRVRKEKYGPDYHAQIGARGGAAGKGRKHSAATKLKISQAKKKGAQERRTHENHKASS